METFLGLMAIIVVGVIIQRLTSSPTKKYKKLLKQPLSKEHRDIVVKNFKLFTYLPEEQQKKLEGLINLFLEEKEFTGCEGLEITDEIRVTIAAQACLLLLNNKTQPWYSKLKSVLVYPSAYKARVKEVNDQGFEESHSIIRLGESWGGGTIVLSWSHSRHGAVNFEDGQNVVLHEFAHQLDQDGGAADGVPVLNSTSSYASWGILMALEYDKLVRRAMKKQKSVMDKYGATNEAEFFAVSTESFFEKPRQMNKKHPELYAALEKYYGLNSLEWDYKNH